MRQASVSWRTSFFSLRSMSILFWVKSKPRILVWNSLINVSEFEAPSFFCFISFEFELVFCLNLLFWDNIWASWFVSIEFCWLELVWEFCKNGIMRAGLFKLLMSGLGWLAVDARRLFRSELLKRSLLPCADPIMFPKLSSGIWVGLSKSGWVESLSFGSSIKFN
jgi:hypothetical protein